jgi:hypothetical protein
MFTTEADMSSPIVRWMRRNDLIVKTEFISPWGICDFVGIQFNQAYVEQRLSISPKKSVTSITRAVLLLHIPSVEDRKSVSVDELAKKFSGIIPRESLYRDLARLASDGFLIQTSNGRLQKRNGCMPLPNRLVAVEAKLHRINEALQQARANLGFSVESYAAFPMALAKRIASNAKPWQKFFDEGIGLIGVATNRCELLIQSKSNPSNHDPAVRFYCSEKFWNEIAHSKGN